MCIFVGLILHEYLFFSILCRRKLGVKCKLQENNKHDIFNKVIKGTNILTRMIQFKRDKRVGQWGSYGIK